MSGPAFRFLHTGDWLLHQVCYGFAEIPEPVRELLIDAVRLQLRADVPEFAGVCDCDEVRLRVVAGWNVDVDFAPLQAHGTGGDHFELRTRQHAQIAAAAQREQRAGPHVEALARTDLRTHGEDRIPP